MWSPFQTFELLRHACSVCHSPFLQKNQESIQKLTRTANPRLGTKWMWNCDDVVRKKTVSNISAMYYEQRWSTPSQLIAQREMLDSFAKSARIGPGFNGSHQVPVIVSLSHGLMQFLLHTPNLIRIKYFTIPLKLRTTKLGSVFLLDKNVPHNVTFEIKQKTGWISTFIQFILLQWTRLNTKNADVQRNQMSSDCLGINMCFGEIKTKKIPGQLALSSCSCTRWCCS